MRLAMNLSARAKVVRAMETIARCVNDEEVFYRWLLCGVADSDIDDDTTDEDLECYCEDKTFADLMERFLDLMTAAKNSGGLYADRIVSKYEEN